jgi:hypothetical protein
MQSKPVVLPDDFDGLVCVLDLDILLFSCQQTMIMKEDRYIDKNDYFSPCARAQDKTKGLNINYYECIERFL